MSPPAGAGPAPRRGHPREALRRAPGAVRRARDRDLDRLLALYERLAEHHGPPFALRGAGDPALRGHLEARLRDPEASCLVAEQDGDLLGFCLAVVARRPAFFAETERLEVEALYVRPERRRAGLARALVEAALAALDPGGRLRVELGVERGNAEGGGFWRALGFRPVMDVLERRR